MAQDPPKQALSFPDIRRWIIVGMFTGAMFLGLPVFPVIWQAVASNFPVGFHLVTTLMLPVCLLALVVGIRKTTGSQSRIFSGVVVGLCMGFGLLVHGMVSTPAEQFHAAEYALLAALVYRAPAHGVSRRARSLIALASTFVIGLADEAVQYVLPNRVFDPRDILLNWTAGAFGVCISMIVHGQRNSEHRQKKAPVGFEVNSGGTPQPERIAP